MKLLFYWNLCTREAKNVEKNVSGFLFLWRFVVIIDSFLISSSFKRK